MSANSPRLMARVPPDIEQAARRADPALADADPSTLVRVALMVLAGYALTDALRKARMPMGPKPR
jgi:hypothetical protein